MPKTAVRTAVCDICGAEVRGGSLFCYNCGGSLSKTVLTPVETDVVEAPASVPDLVVANGDHSHETPLEPARRDADKPKRKKIRAANRQPVEVVWEPRTGISWPFIVASMIFFLLSILIVIASFYIR